MRPHPRRAPQCHHPRPRRTEEPNKARSHQGERIAKVTTAGVRGAKPLRQGVLGLAPTRHKRPARSALSAGARRPPVGVTGFEPATLFDQKQTERSACDASPLVGANIDVSGRPPERPILRLGCQAVRQACRRPGNALSEPSATIVTVGKLLGRVILVALVVFGVWYAFSHYAGGTKFGCQVSGAVAHADSGDCPTSVGAADGDAQWAAGRWTTIKDT